MGEDYFNFLKSKMCYVSLLNDYSFNKYFVLRTPYDTYYGKFDPPFNKMEMLEIHPQIKGRHLDAEIIQNLEGKIPKELLYTCFKYIYSKRRKKNRDRKEHPNPNEKYIIHLFYKNGIIM